MNGISGSAVAGINSGLANLATDAQVVAQSVSGTGAGLSVAAMVDATVQRLAIEASAQMLKTENQTLGSLIDAFA